MSDLLFQLGPYLRTPGGEVENVAEQKAAGVTWAALNIGGDVGFDESVWDSQRAKYASAGISVGPWMHCHSLDDITRVIQVGKAWNAALVGPNLEDVISEGVDLRQAGQLIASQWGTQNVHVASVPWLQNGAGWQYIDFATFALELFPEAPGGQFYLDRYRDCISHAFSEGCKKVTLLYSSQSPRSVYPNVAHCIYTANNVTDWSEWHDSVPQPVPPPPEVPPVSLTPTEKKNFRTQLTRFALVAEKYERFWHYSQVRPFTGLMTPMSDVHYDDCSAYLSILFYKSGRASGHPVADPLGQHYSGYGNTGTAYEFLKEHLAPKDKYRVGDVALYLEAGSFEDHVVICRKAGTGTTSVWTSNGSEAGPDARSLHYRPDLTGVYRHPALL